MSDLIKQLTNKIKGLDFTQACEQTVHFLQQALPHYNWLGIYLLEGDELVLGAWVGPEATEHVRIPVGQGICGLAVREQRTVIVDDVNADPRYLACFPSTRAEIVVPIATPEGKIIGEIDIDSDKAAAFSTDDQELLEQVAELLGYKFSLAAV